LSDGASPSAGATRISRDVLRTQVKSQLMKGIVEGRYPPGSRLVETRIARELGVSQAPVREALRDLESVGLVESVAFRGSRVRQPSRAELVEAFPVRAALESLAASEAAARVTDGDVEELERLITAMVHAARRRDAHAQSVANARFHARIVRVAGNPTLERQWALLEPFARTYLTASHAGIDLVRLAERHRGVLSPLRARDPTAAAAAMRDHLMEACRWLQDGAAGANGADAVDGAPR
jgi:DNA-binding GntR family transcriptional regulator